jgi:hypothetical protein
LQSIARDLRIGVDALLFIDDNAGELASISAQLDGTRFLHAGADPHVTWRALAAFPACISGATTGQMNYGSLIWPQRHNEWMPPLKVLARLLEVASRHSWLSSQPGD